jgi:hypothetical protein
MYDRGVIDALISALERTQRNFVLAVQGKPVRDMCENLAENAAALAAVPQGQGAQPQRDGGAADRMARRRETFRSSHARFTAMPERRQDELLAGIDRADRDAREIGRRCGTAGDAQPGQWYVRDGRDDEGDPFHYCEAHGPAGAHCVGRARHSSNHQWAWPSIEARTRGDAILGAQREAETET